MTGQPRAREHASPERSPSGRVMFHVPAAGEVEAVPRTSDVREVLSPEEDEARRKKRTPDERPRRARRHARERPRADTPAARPLGRRSSPDPVTIPPVAGREPSVIIALPPGQAQRVVPIQQRSSAPPPRAPWRSALVRTALAVAAGIVIGAVLLKLLR